MAAPIRVQLYDAYFANAVRTGHSQPGETSIPCPLCLKPIERAAVVANVVAKEHIVPQHATADKVQRTPHTQIGVKNTRSGLTLTCSECNGFKGRKLDGLLRGRAGSTPQSEADYPFETATAILTYAYLFAFAILGYEYVCHPDLEEVRRQFSDPTVRHSRWLEHAHVNLKPPESIIVTTENGYPCVFAHRVGHPMQVFSWRFRASLPNADFVKNPVDIPTVLRELLE